MNTCFTEDVENATMSSLPSPLISPVEIDVALSQVWIGVDIVSPLPEFQSAQTIEVELLDCMSSKNIGSVTIIIDISFNHLLMEPIGKIHRRIW